jgi:hypothetical protein
MTDTALRRLLNLFPASAIKGQWTAEGTGRRKGDMVGGIVASAATANIVDFCRTEMGLTKQHVRIFSHGLKLSALPDNLLRDLGLSFKNAIPTEREYFYLVPTRFNYVAGSPPVEGYLDFLWPVKLVFRSHILEAFFTTMEKKIGSYVDEGSTFHVQRSIDVDEFMTFLMKELKQGISPLDINAGIKSMWEEDLIDSGKAQWKESNSTLIDTMDGSFLLKRDKPEFYKRAVQGPLFKTVFKCLDKDAAWPEIFSADACKGELATTRYNNDRDAVENLVREILRRN